MSTSPPTSQDKATPSPDTAAGQTFNLPGYTVLRTLGKGGMGEVFLAERTSDVGVSVRCVVKTILPASSDDPLLRQLFMDEVRLVAGLRHPNLISVLDVGEADGRLYQVIEWVEGVDAGELAEREQRHADGIPLKHLLYLMREVLQGLHYAHTATDPSGNPLNIVHRDISPGNILVSKQGAVKLADFGVAVATTSQTEGVHEGLAGKPHYFSPELWRGARASPQSDVYAMGVTLYELLSLKPLFSRTKTLQALAWEIVNFHPTQLIEQDLTLVEGIEQILLRSLAPDPADRYESALEFLEDVNDYAYEYGIRLLDAHFSRYIEGVLDPKPPSHDRKKLFRSND